MKFYKIHPEVPGGVGKNMEYDKTEIPWKITHLHVVFEGWLGGDLLKISTCYLVTDTLKEKIQSAQLTGILGFKSFEFELSDTFKRLYPGKSLPGLHWMQLTTELGKFDLAMNDKNKLIVTETAMKVLREANLSDAEIEEIQ